MCLQIYEKGSTLGPHSLEEKLRTRRRQVFYAYKVYRTPARGLGGAYIQPPYFDTLIRSPGKVVSNRVSGLLSVDEYLTKRVDVGIHVFLKRVGAEEFRHKGTLSHPEVHQEVVVKVKCRREDIVANGVFLPHTAAVLMKIEIEQEEWDRIFPGG